MPFQTKSPQLVRKTFVCLAGLSLLALPQSAFADVKAGVDAWARGDYDAAIKEWRQPAVEGDVDAQFNMGQAYKFGRGVPMDLNIASDWFRKAAEKGHLQAADNYGLILFQNGQRKEALPWLESSAARGEARAQYIMGTAYFNGDLVAKDWVRAYALMTRASSSGLPQASKNLAAMDRYLTPRQRQEGIVLAGNLQEQADRERQRQLAGATLPPVAGDNLPTRSSGSTQPLQQAALPPSRPVSKPTITPSTAPRSGTDFASAGNSGIGADFAQPKTAPKTINGANASARPVAGFPAQGARPTILGSANAAARPAPSVTRPAPAPASAPARVAASGGAWRLQLGAFGSQDKAATIWSSLENRNAALQGLQPYLVNTSKVTRLQVGDFSSRAEADRLCTQLKATGQACFPIKR
jgi:cell division septation protein DedD